MGASDRAALGAAKQRPKLLAMASSPIVGRQMGGGPGRAPKALCGAGWPPSGVFRPQKGGPCDDLTRT
eukprot:13983998-Alexandrium_andersonii.AAC.1